MNLDNVINVLTIIPELKVNSKKQLLQIIAEKASQIIQVQERVIFDTLLQREQLGSTGIGEGVALPHAKLNDLDKITGIFVCLSSPVDFEAPDNKPIDLVFCLLAPNSAGADHLKALASITRIMKNQETRDRLRKAHNCEKIREILSAATISPSIKALSDS